MPRAAPTAGGSPRNPAAKQPKVAPMNRDYGGVVFNKLDGHREIIDRRAAEGWRYVDHICVQETSGLSA
ncbi:MAG: hypothetical protein IIV27_05625, partial [Clostridia bacterium]|nr:hypothetical protein [Clostridia bacterium]